MAGTHPHQHQLDSESSLQDEDQLRLYVAPSARDAAAAAGEQSANNDTDSLDLVCINNNNRRQGAVAMEQQPRRERSAAGYFPHLPDEVLSRVFAFMPLLNVIKCRLVEKRWRDISQEASFRENYTQVAGELLPIDYVRLLENSPAFSGSQLISSAGGRLLVSNSFEGRTQLFVLNSMTTTVSRLPEMLGLGTARGGVMESIGASSSGGSSRSNRMHELAVVGMVTNSETGVYQILVAQEGARPVRFQVYDSSHGAWRWIGALGIYQFRGINSTPFASDGQFERTLYVGPRDEIIHPAFLHVLHVALYDGALHCLTVLSGRRFFVLRLEPEFNRWMEIPGPFPPNRTQFVCDFRCRPVLFESKGNLMLAGAQVTGEMSMRVHVWVYGGAGGAGAGVGVGGEGQGDGEEEKQMWTEVAIAEEEQMVDAAEEENPDRDAVLCGASYLNTTFFYMDARGDHVCLAAFPSFRYPDPKVLVYSLLQNENDAAAWSLSRLAADEAEKKLVFWQKRARFLDP